MGCCLSIFHIAKPLARASIKTFFSSLWPLWVPVWGSCFLCEVFGACGNPCKELVFWVFMTFHCRCVNLIIFSQTKFFIRNENFIIAPNSSRPNVQVHITRQHINILFHTAVNFTRCVTNSVLVMLDIFPNVYSMIYNVFKIIQKSRLCCESTHSICYYRRSSRSLRT